VCVYHPRSYILYWKIKNFPENFSREREPNLLLIKFQCRSTWNNQSSIAVDRVFKTINICTNYTNYDTQIVNFLDWKKKKKSTDPFFSAYYSTHISFFGLKYTEWATLAQDLLSVSRIVVESFFCHGFFCWWIWRSNRRIP
jgi:hypothetical protein